MLRDNVVIFEGALESLRRFKDDAGEVRAGTECGIGVKNYQDVRVGRPDRVLLARRGCAHHLSSRRRQNDDRASPSASPRIEGADAARAVDAGVARGARIRASATSRSPQ